MSMSTIDLHLLSLPHTHTHTFPKLKLGELALKETFTFLYALLRRDGLSAQSDWALLGLLAARLGKVILQGTPVHITNRQSSYACLHLATMPHSHDWTTCNLHL